MTRQKKHIVLVVLAASLLVAFPARAEVYELAPFKKGGGGGGGHGDFDASAGVRKLWTEPVVINGVEGALTVSITKFDFQKCLELLRNMYPEMRCAANSDSALFELPLENGKRRRVYLVGVGGVFPTIEFSLVIDSSGNKEFVWPRELPLIPGSAPESSIQFPQRRSSCGTFTTSSEPGRAKDEYQRLLLSEGWCAPAPGGGKGDCYMSKDSKELILVSFDRRGDGNTVGSVFRKSLRK